MDGIPLWCSCGYPVRLTTRRRDMRLEVVLTEMETDVVVWECPHCGFDMEADFAGLRDEPPRLPSREDMI